MYDFLKFDESAVLEEAIVKYEDATNTKLYAGDERRILLNSFMYIATVIASNANYLANQYFAKTAEGEYLSYIGESRLVPRISAKKATVTMRFMIDSALTVDIDIPKGTRVTPEGSYFFATTEARVLMHGERYVDVPAEATASGSGHNGFTPGTINTLVDNVSYISSVTNTNTSGDGAAIEDIENYRERILLKPYNYNTAGAEKAYIYLAKSADSLVGSVDVQMSPSSLIITILCKDGSIPDDTLISKVTAALSGKEVRPLSDYITVQKAVEVLYGINLSYTIDADNTDNVDIIKKQIAESVKEYQAYHSAELGRSINPDVLKKYILNAGAYTVTVNSPIFIAVNKQSVAHLSGDAVTTYQGIYMEG